MKFGTHVLSEVLNQTIPALLAQPTKIASYRDFWKKSRKWDNLWTPWDIYLIFSVGLYYIHLLFSAKFFGNRMTQTSPTNQPAKNLLRWITSIKIVRFGWNLVCKLVTTPAHHYCPPLPPLPTVTAPAHPFRRGPQYFSDFFYISIKFISTPSLKFGKF